MVSIYFKVKLKRRWNNVEIESCQRWNDLCNMGKVVVSLLHNIFQRCFDVGYQLRINVVQCWKSNFQSPIKAISKLIHNFDLQRWLTLRLWQEVKFWLAMKNFQIPSKLILVCYKRTLNSCKRRFVWKRYQYKRSYVSSHWNIQEVSKYF